MVRRILVIVAGLTLACQPQASSETPARTQRPASDANAPQATAQAPAPTLKGVLDFLKNLKALQKMTPQSVRADMSRLIADLRDKGQDQVTWDFEGTRQEGLVRKIAVSFGASKTGPWPLQNVAVTLRPTDQGQAFEEIGRTLTTSLGEPTWAQPNAGSPKQRGWNLGDGWELAAAMEPSGEIRLETYQPTED
jgi:hypothetical protein